MLQFEHRNAPHVMELPYLKKEGDSRLLGSVRRVHVAGFYEKVHRNNLKLKNMKY